VAIRNRLYTILGAGRARQMLAGTFPGGSARNEIRRRVLANSEKGEARAAMISAIIEEIVEEIIEESKKLAKEEAGGRVKSLV